MITRFEPEHASATSHDPHVAMRSTAVFMPLFAPFGISSGYVSVTLAFLLGRAGMSTLSITTIIAATLWVQTWKVLWAPVVDTVGNPKAWYAVGTIGVGATIFAMSLLPATAVGVPALTTLAVLSSAASTLVSMSSEIFLAQCVPADLRGRASGWAQAGNLGGAGVGGGIGLVLAQHVSQPWVSGAVLAAICVACWGCVYFVPRAHRPAAASSYLGELTAVARDVWDVARSRIGYLALILMVLPIASGAAPWSAIAGEWKAEADLVALLGVVGGLASAAGALVGGYVCDRMSPSRAYCAFGLIAGAITVVMAWSARTPAAFVVFTLGYGTAVGCGYAAYSAIVLEAIGRRSAATNFNLMASLSNVPIALMTTFDGWVHDRFGTDAMLYGELVLPAATIAAFALFVVATRPGRCRGEPRCRAEVASRPPSTRRDVARSRPLKVGPPCQAFRLVDRGETPYRERIEATQRTHEAIGMTSGIVDGTRTKRRVVRKSLFDGSMPRRGPAFVFALALIASTLPTRATAACQVDTVEMPVTMSGPRAIATVGINGTPVPLTVDSGAFFSMLTDAAADQLKLRVRRNDALRVEGVTGRAEARTTSVDRLRLFKGEISHVDFVVGGNEPGSGTMGYLGRNLLSLTDTEYDLAHGAIRFLTPHDGCGDSNMAYWAGSTPVTEVDLLRNGRSQLPSIRAYVKLNGKEFIAMFDTGATTVVTAKAARRAGVADADLKPSGVVYGVGRGSAKAWTAPFETFELGGESIRRNHLLVADIDLDDSDLLLGIDFFLAHRIYVSNDQSKLFVTYNGGAVFALDKLESAGDAVAAADREAPIADATTADQFARRGAASAARHDYESALADLNRACELEPTSAAFFAQRGTIQVALKQLPKATEDFDRALALDPTHADAHYQRAALRLIVKDRDGAKADLDALDKALPPQAQMRLRMAELYLGLDQPALALAELNQWLPAHPNEIRREAALNNRCWARVLLGIELDRAIDDCDDAIDADSKNPVYLDSRGWAYLRMGKNAKALADFDRSIEYRPNSASALYGRGLARTRLGDGARGEADLASARKAQPTIERRLAHNGLIPEPVGATAQP